MKKALWLCLLFIISLGISLVGVRLSMPIDGLPMGVRHRPLPPRDSRTPPPPTPERLCEQGDWQACVTQSELDPTRRAVWLHIAERRLDWICHNGMVRSMDESATMVEACGHLAAMRMERSPREVPRARNCIDHALSCRTCVAKDLPDVLLDRPEWVGWCASGDELACEILEAAANKNDRT